MSKFRPDVGDWMYQVSNPPVFGQVVEITPRFYILKTEDGETVRVGTRQMKQYGTHAYWLVCDPDKEAVQQEYLEKEQKKAERERAWQEKLAAVRQANYPFEITPLFDTWQYCKFVNKTGKGGVALFEVSRAYDESKVQLDNVVLYFPDRFRPGRRSILTCYASIGDSIDEILADLIASFCWE